MIWTTLYPTQPAYYWYRGKAKIPRVGRFFIRNKKLVCSGLFAEKAIEFSDRPVSLPLENTWLTGKKAIEYIEALND